MKALTLISLLALSSCAGYQAEGVLSTFSKHSRETTPAGKPYNENNLGAGIHVTTKDWLSSGWRKGVLAMSYDNSLNRQSNLVAGTIDYCHEDGIRVCGGVMAGGVTGYGGVSPVIAPTAEIGYGKVSLVGTMFPTSDMRALVGTILIKVKLWEF